MNYLNIIWKILSNKLTLLAIIAGLVYLSYYFSKRTKEVLITTEVVRVDTVTVESQINEITLSTYKRMNDEKTKAIKKLQEELGIRNSELKEAQRIIAEIRDSVYGRVDTVLIKQDSLHLEYHDDWTNIEAQGRLSKPDSILVTYSTDANLTAITHTAYKPAKTKFGKWWYRLWKVGKHEDITIRSDNPNLEIKSVEILKIKDNE